VKAFFFWPYGPIQRLYEIFSTSTFRWDILCKHLKITLQPQSDTGWKARIQSVSAVRFQLKETYHALEELINSAKDNAIVSEANSLLKHIQKLPFIISIIVWYDILNDVNQINKYLYAIN
jgi:hypothetical protein